MGRNEECRIGVTGHRIVMEVNKLRSGLVDAFNLIEQAFSGRPIVLYSSLAEGADQLAAETILQRPQGRLAVVLPFPPAEYAQDFLSADGQAAFESFLSRADRVLTLPKVSDRNQAFEDAGRWVLAECDVLLAVWDGQISQGQGGTGQIVTAARAQSKPLVIVRAGNRLPGTQEPTTLGHEQGLVLVEHLSHIRTENRRADS